MSQNMLWSQKGWDLPLNWMWGSENGVKHDYKMSVVFGNKKSLMKFVSSNHEVIINWCKLL